MSLPVIVQKNLSSMDAQSQKSFKRDFNASKNSTLMAYVAWFLLGWHYLYLGQVLMQFAFWFTAGFLIVGWPGSMIISPTN